MLFNIVAFNNDKTLDNIDRYCFDQRCSTSSLSRSVDEASYRNIFQYFIYIKKMENNKKFEAII